MKQPHVYTLPEQFIRDPSVPLKWKLYTIINGFWIGGKPVFASNKFFAEKLGCTERHIQDCLALLEKDHLITRNGKSQNRRIIPGGRTDSSWRDEPATVVRDEPAVHHIAYSIADSNSESEIRTRLPLKESEDTDKPPRVGKGEREAYETLLRWAEEERGAKFVHRTKQYKALKQAKTIGLKAGDLKERWEQMSEELFWSDKGFDWTNVVASFDRKGV